MKIQNLTRKFTQKENFFEKPARLIFDVVTSDQGMSTLAEIAPEEDATFWQQVGRSFWYGLKFALPSFFVAFFIWRPLFVGSAISFSRAILTKEFYETNQKMLILVNFFQAHHSFLNYIFYALFIIFAIYISWLVVGLVNKNFKWKKLKIKSIKRWHIIIWIYFLSPLLIGLCSYLFILLGSFIVDFAEKFTLELLVSSGLFWILWHDEGLMGDFSHFSRKKEKRTKLFKKISLNTLIYLFPLGAFYAFALFILKDYGKIVFVNVFDFLNQFSVSLQGHYLMAISLIVILGVGSFISGSLLYLLVAKKTRDFSARLIVPFLTMAIVLISVKVVYLKAQKYDFVPQTNISLEEFFSFSRAMPAATGLKQESEILDIPLGSETNKIIFTFEDNAIKKEIINYACDNKSIHFITSYKLNETIHNESGLNCEISNLKRAEAYLEKKNYQTIIASNISQYIARRYYHYWDLENFSYALLENAEKTQDIISGLILITKISREFAEYDSVYLDILDQLTDENRFYIGHNPAKEIGDIYLKFGQYDKAEKFYQLAKERGSQREIPEINKIAKVLLDGKLQGEIILQDKPLQNIKVALAKEDTKEIRSDQPLAVTKTNSKGEFEWNNLLAGEYYLMIMVDPEDLPKDLDNLHLKKPLGKINLSLDNSEVDVGKIEILNTQKTSRIKRAR